MPSKRSVESAVDDLHQQAAGSDSDGPAAVEVEWRDPAPDDRSRGMTWEPSGDDEPATLTYGVWSAQRETLKAVESGTHDIVAFLAGYGSGKSVFGARWLLTQALEYPGSKFLAMGQDFKKARDTTFTKLFAQLPGERTTLTTSGFNGPENSPVVVDYNRQQHRLTLVNDSVIVLGSADEYSRYAGAEFGGAWLDEPSHYGDDLHELTGMITTRLRGVEGPKTQVWTLSGDGYNAAWEILEKRQDADGDPIGLDIDVVTASVLDNPYLPDGDKARFRRKYEGTGKEEQALHGGFAAASGLVYSDFSRETHVIDHADAVEQLHDGGGGEWRVYGYDAGWRDPRVLLEIGRTNYGQLVVLDEFHESESHVDDVIRWLTTGKKPTGRIYAEHEPADIQKLRKAGYGATKAEKSIRAGISEVRRRLEIDTEGRVGLLVSDQCQHLIREFLGYKEDHVGTSQATDHCCDALRYSVMGVGGGGGISGDNGRRWTSDFSRSAGGPVDMSGLLTRGDNGVSFL